MDNNFIQEQNYIRAKKKVKEIKGFYVHFIIYIIINMVLSGIIFYGLTREGDDTYSEAFSNFGLYSTWVFWGI